MCGKTTGNRLQVLPTRGHQVLAALQEKGLLHHWLQQNHDRLAQKSGYPMEKLNEIHGAWGDDKNSVLMMDDQLRPDLLEWMEAWKKECTLCLALGTSLCGMTADGVADAAALRSAPSGQGLVIANLQRTPKDAQSCLRIWGLLDDVLNLLAEEMKVKVPNRACVTRGEEWMRSHPNCRYNTPKRKANAPL
jgi:NAD-dependent SIR2 family protein deacetylase